MITSLNFKYFAYGKSANPSHCVPTFFFFCVIIQISMHENDFTAEYA